MKKAEATYNRSLYEAAAALNSTQSPEEILNTLVEHVAKALDAKGCSLMLLTPDRKLLLHTAAYGLSDWYIRKGPLRADQSIAEALEGKAVAVYNAAEDERVQYRTQAQKEGIASVLSAPMKLRGETIGVIRVYTAKPHRFTMSEIDFVSSMANFGAIALENTRLHETLQKHQDEFRREMLEWRASLGAEWIAERGVVTPLEDEPLPQSRG
ncbi:MAG: GAF domain-containing protein [Chloroflexi bacterium]|nr:GAF domain-containing protein [Chloroflexota bacterium]